jgi:simple sugar transport system permease protein
MVWMVLPLKNQSIIWPQGHGLRTTTVLKGSYEKILDKFLAINIGPEFVFPTGLFLFFFAFCLLIWLFLRSRTGMLMKIGGSNPIFAKSIGINVDNTRILGMVLSTSLGAIGIIAYSQSYGFYQYYSAPLMMAFAAVAAILIGGADNKKASIFNVIVGTTLFQGLLTLALPVANVVMPKGNMAEIMRIVVSNGIILYALTKAGGKQ